METSRPIIKRKEPTIEEPVQLDLDENQVEVEDEDKIISIKINKSGEMTLGFNKEFQSHEAVGVMVISLVDVLVKQLLVPHLQVIVDSIVNVGGQLHESIQQGSSPSPQGIKGDSNNELVGALQEVLTKFKS